MLLRNISPLLVNGTIGYVQDFVPMNNSLLPPDLRSQLRKRIFPSKPTTLLPLVKFSAYQHAVLIPEMSFHFTSARIPGRTLQASVMPLVAAYAFTVHKLQGVTLHQPVQLDCTSMWSCPHLIYVAASRVRKQSHFRMRGFQPSFVQISQEAYNFMKQLPSVSEAEPLYSGKQIVKPSLS
jgi:ATP-dependent exoDNAse (exonuclease V) alpha subunit